MVGTNLLRFHFKWWGLVFVLPAVGFFATFSIFPMLFGLYLSFTDYDLLNPPLWVGLDNFANLVSDPLFRKALANTLMFVAGATVPVWVLSLLAALLFDQAFRGRDILKATFFLPVLPPVVVVAIIWRVLLHPNGVMTWLVGGQWGLTEIRWLADAVLAPLSMIAVHDWAAIPFFMVIWLAGLAGVPAEQREAASLDGAGAGADVLAYRTAASALDGGTGGGAVLDQCVPDFRSAVRAAERSRRAGEFDAGAWAPGAEIRVPVFPHGRRGGGVDGDVRDDPCGDDGPVVVQPPCISDGFVS